MLLNQSGFVEQLSERCTYTSVGFKISDMSRNVGFYRTHEICSLLGNVGDMDTLLLLCSLPPALEEPPLLDLGGWPALRWGVVIDAEGGLSQPPVLVIVIIILFQVLKIVLGKNGKMFCTHQKKKLVLSLYTLLDVHPST